MGDCQTAWIHMGHCAFEDYAQIAIQQLRPKNARPFDGFLGNCPIIQIPELHRSIEDSFIPFQKELGSLVPLLPTHGWILSCDSFDCPVRCGGADLSESRTTPTSPRTQDLMLSFSVRVPKFRLHHEPQSETTRCSFISSHPPPLVATRGGELCSSHTTCTWREAANGGLENSSLLGFQEQTSKWPLFRKVT